MSLTGNFDCVAQLDALTTPSPYTSYSLHRFRDLTSRAEEERDVQIEKSKGLLADIEQKRILRARVSSFEDSIIEVKDWTTKAQRHNEER